MLQHQETSPRTRVTLYLEWPRSADVDTHREEWNVWELAELVPPSTARELDLPMSGDPREAARERPSSAQAACREQLHLPAVVLEVDADGTVTPWPGPEVVDPT